MNLRTFAHVNALVGRVTRAFRRALGALSPRPRPPLPHAGRHLRLGARAPAVVAARAARRRRWPELRIDVEAEVGLLHGRRIGNAKPSPRATAHAAPRGEPRRTTAAGSAASRHDVTRQHLTGAPRSPLPCMHEGRERWGCATRCRGRSRRKERRPPASFNGRADSRHRDGRGSRRAW
jgi:hypothetical protein